MHVETALSAALSRAGVDTSASRLRMAADAAMAKHHNNIERATKTFLLEASNSGLLKELAAFYLARYRMPEADHSFSDTHSATVSDRLSNGDDDGHREVDNQLKNAASSPTPSRNGEGLGSHDAPPFAALPVREPSAAQTATDLSVKTRIALNAFDRELTRTGQRWGNVCYSELANMTEDGEIAEAIRLHIGSLRGEKALKPIRELMTPREFAILYNKNKRERV